jgi:hypothetical protein
MAILSDVDETGDLIGGPTSTLETLHLHSADTDALWIHVYDSATAAAVVEGTTEPVLSFRLPAGEDRTWSPFQPFTAGIVIAATQEFSGGATGPGANEVRGCVVIR